MRTKILIFFLLLASTTFGQSAEFPFPSGEKMTFSAYYHWGLFWLEAGEVVFQVDIVPQKNKVYVEMQSLGKTLPKYDWLFKVRDTFYSQAMYPSMKPLFFKRANYEGKDRVVNYYTFNQEKKSLIRDMESNGSARKIDTITLPNEHILDVQTAVYYARLWDFKNAKPGDQKLVKLILGGSFYTIPMTYHGKEIVKHKNGKQYSCYKIITEVAAGLIFKANQEISVYISDDSKQIPLVVRAPILIGKVEAFLEQIEGGEFPKSIPD